MNREELDLLESVFTLAIGECAYNDINNIQKLEDKIKTINNLCKKQKEVIDKAIEYINDNLTISSILDGEKYYTINNYSFDYKELLDILNEVTNNESNNQHHE